MKRNSLLAFGVSVLLLYSCEDPKQNCYLNDPVISVNGEPLTSETVELDLLVNQQIWLTSGYDSNFDVTWTGPNSFTSNAGVVSFPNDGNASGTYTLKVNRGICSTEKTFNIEINSINITCTPQNNRITFSQGLNAMNFNSNLGGVFSDQYQFLCSAPNGDLTIVFPNADKPSTGTYQINSSCPTSFLDPGTVCMWLTYSGQFATAQGGQIYVNEVAPNKYEVLFCDIVFNVELPVEMKASGKVTVDAL